MSEASELEPTVGHPGEKWDALKDRVQNEHVQAFSDVADDWLDVMWTLDCYRNVGIPPRGMGNQTKTPAKRLAAVYRRKGNWFATLLSLLLGNQTSHRLASRLRVQGFSQSHQIDVAWPDREVDPLICLETNVTGAPPTPSDPARGAMADWTNRRKELKFAATDLKLFRRQHLTAIHHWDVWRGSVYPKTYFLWAARLRPSDDIEKMVTESQVLVKTYLEGAGLIAWRSFNDHYEIQPIPTTDRISTVDDVLYRIATEIGMIAPPGHPPPPPQIPVERVIDTSSIDIDNESSG
jgi:hypothetical protein